MTTEILTKYKYIGYVADISLYEKTVIKEILGNSTRDYPGGLCFCCGGDHRLLQILPMSELPAGVSGEFCAPCPPYLGIVNFHFDFTECNLSNTEVDILCDR